MIASCSRQCDWSRAAHHHAERDVYDPLPLASCIQQLALVRSSIGGTSMNRGGFTILQAFLVVGYLTIGADAHAQPIHVSPAAVHLNNPEATQQILVANANRTTDLTRIATYAMVDGKIASVDAAGLVQPIAEGKTTLIVRHDKSETRIPVEVSGMKAPTPVAFDTQIMPILSRAGCNMGSCHGKAEGKNGFKLSIFGFDPAADYEALTMEPRGRRFFPAAPPRSLMLMKAAGQVAHGGGRRITTESLHYQRLHRWIAEGAANHTGAEIKSIEVE